MFKALNEKKDVEGATEHDELEEQYQRMFKKIARDFVHKDDLASIMNEYTEYLFTIIPGLEESLQDNTFENKRDSAVNKALEYKENLKRPKHKRKKYKDVIEDW